MTRQRCTRRSISCLSWASSPLSSWHSRQSSSSKAHPPRSCCATETSSCNGQSLLCSLLRIAQAASLADRPSRLRHRPCLRCLLQRSARSSEYVKPFYICAHVFKGSIVKKPSRSQAGVCRSVVPAARLQDGRWQVPDKPLPPGNSHQRKPWHVPSFQACLVKFLYPPYFRALIVQIY